MTLSDEQALWDCGAVTDDGVTYAALILFGKRVSLDKYLPHAEIVFEYRSSEAAGPAGQRVDFRDGFFNNFDRIWELVNLRNDNQHYQNGFVINPISTFNEQVVREAILNAVSHRDYQLGGSIFVRQYSRRIVVESPGGFPWGITVDNILDKQSPRNDLIVKIFQLSGLVERSGQGMNLIYEMAIKEAKPLPDFTGSDAYFVRLTLNGKVIDRRMLALIKGIDDEQLDAMTTDDYILLRTLFLGKDITDVSQSRFEHLAELGIIRYTEYGMELVDGDKTLMIYEKILPYKHSRPSLSNDKQAIAKRLQGDCHENEECDRKKHITAFIEDNGIATSSQIANFIGLTQGYMRTLLRKLASDGVIKKIGDKRYTYYILAKSDDC
jgi:ATP-dependent DNA helicase RecG